MVRKLLVSIVAAFALGACSDLLGQVATGTPGFDSFGGGPFDSIDLGNLNIHFAVPIIQKAGRGMPFDYSVSYDGAVWTTSIVNGQKTWQPVFNWGWSAQTAIKVGYISFSKVTQVCDWPPPKHGTYTIWSSYTYHDPWGGSHAFYGTLEQDSTNCDNGNTTSFTEAATDGSGYTLSATYTKNTMTTRSGETINPPVNLTSGYSSGSYSATDANGNQISVSNTSGSATFTDTLGTSALTVSGTSPVTFAYTAPSGSAQYTLNYVQYTVRTNFSVSGVPNEYGPLSNALADNIQLPDGTKYTFTYEKTPGSCTPLSGTFSAYCVTGRLASVTLPTGGAITYEYSGGPSSTGIFSDGSTASLTRILAANTSCAGPCWQYTRALASGSPGPGSMWTTTVVDPSGNHTVVNFVEDGNTSQPTYAVYETERKVYQGTSTLLSTTINCYNGQNVNSPANCYTTPITSPLTRVTMFRYLPDSSSSGVQAETDTTYDSFGLVHEVDEYNYGHGAVGGVLRKTITTYAALGNGIVDRPLSVTVKDAGNNTIAYTSYGYDETTPTQTSGTPQHISVTGSRGLLTSVQAQASGTTNLYRKYSYYDTGTLSTSTDVSTSRTTNGAATTYNYSSGSCGNSFVTSTNEPLSLSRSMTWDCNGGVMLSLADENGNTTSTAYSGSNYTNQFWRPYSATDQAGNVTNYFYYLNSSNQKFQSETKSATFNSGNSIIDVLTTTDGFGRPIFRQTKAGPNASNYDTVATCYDSSGRVSLTTLSYSAAAITSSSDTCPSSNPGTSNAYDALGRQTSVSDSGGGVTSYSYNTSDVLVTRTSPSQSKQLEYDSLGRLGSVCEITAGTSSWPASSCSQVTSATGYLTQYTYDALSDLTSVTQNGQAPSGHQTRGYTYDMLGRLTQETNPEMNNSALTYVYDTLSSDSACGTYTSAGNLLKRLDPAGNASCYSSYDALHRVGTIIYPSTSTPAKYFVYDSATVNGSAMPYAKTRLAEAYTCTGTCTSKITDLGFGYSKNGQTTDVWELTPHSGSYYHVAASPWPNGAINTLSGVPGLSTITYSTDGEGRMGTVSASGQSPVTAVSYNAAGQVYAMTFGSSDSDSFQFDPSTGRMIGYAFNVGSTPQTVSGSLGWNSNGSLNALAIIDPFNSNNSQACSYSHDPLGRAASISCGSETSLLNLGFESGNIDWILSSGWSIVNNPSNAQSGNYYLSGTSTTDTATFATTNGSNQWVAVSPGSLVQYGGWVNRLSGTGYASWGCEVVDSNHNLLAWCSPAGITDRTSGPGWRYYEGSINVPSNGAYIQFYAELHCCGDPDTSSTTGYFDTATFTASGALWGQNFSYDPFGNITKTVPTGSTGTSFNVSYDYTNNTNRITTSPFSYASTSDPNAKTGNMTNDGSHTYSWDTDGHVTAIDSGSSSGICLVYDALGRAVEKQTGSSCTTSSTEIVYSPSGTKLALMNGSSLVKAFVPLPGGAQAVYNSSGLQYYRHPDWLGSSRLATTPSRTMYFDAAYAPYGENYSGSGTQDLAFTGQNQDLEPSGAGGAGGLYDFLYREHSPVQGRWLSPDPLGLGATNPADPQTWNRYAYVGNRPLNNRDPLGTLLEYCPPEYSDCGGGGGGGCDPEFGCGCDPFDPTCGGGGGGGGGGGNPGPPPSQPPPQRTGGVWPNNETMGLPSGLNTSPLQALSSLLGLLPGLSCGGGSSFIESAPTTSGSNRDCVPPIVFVSIGVLAAASSEPAKDNKPNDKCTASETKLGLDYCADHGWIRVSGWQCEGDMDCCRTKVSTFNTGCYAKNDYYDKKAGVRRYEPIDVFTYTFAAAVCCKKW